MDYQMLIRTGLQLVFNIGVDPETGEPTTKSKTFNNIKVDATGEQLYRAALALESLQQHPLSNILRKDTYDIAGE